MYKRQDLPKALEDGVCFDGSSIAGFMKVEESDLVLRPDLSTVTILPWRPTEGRVMQFFCDVEKPDGQPFGGNCRGFLRSVNCKFKKLGITCNVGAECEFYLFENDDRGRPTRIPVSYTHLDVYKRQGVGFVIGQVLFADNLHDCFLDHFLNPP